MLGILWLRDKGVRAVLTGALAVSMFSAAAQAVFSAAAQAAPALVVDAASGDVLYQQEATRPWYPASLTKLMTVYVALSAIRDHKISLDTPLIVSARAAAMPPSKMGFTPGTEVTLDNALKMLMVHSANDIAVSIAEGVSGSVEAFAEDMNATAARLGLRESHFANPNGLPDPNHYSSARDMAQIARALYVAFPEQAGLFDIGALTLDGRVIPNHNNMLGRFPGVDGMKTGYTCPAGFNIVVSAFRNGRRLVAVILGAPTPATRTIKAAILLDRGFQGIDRPSGLSLIALPSAAAAGPPDLRALVCKRRPQAAMAAQFKAEAAQLAAPLQPLAPLQPKGPGAPQPYETALSETVGPNFEPVPVHIGREPGYVGPVAQARPPHSPVGTDPGPDAIAYAPPQPAEATPSPLKPDANALPLRGRAPVKHARHRDGAKKEAVGKDGDKKEVRKKEAGKKEPPAPAAVAKHEPAPPARPKANPDLKSSGSE